MILTREELIAFNPILEKALSEYKPTSPFRKLEMGFVKHTVAEFVRAGAEPRLIYAFIRTGRILTEEGMKRLSKEDVKEWDAALKEYDRLERL